MWWHNATVLFRHPKFSGIQSSQSHLSGTLGCTSPPCPHIQILQYHSYPEAEEFAANLLPAWESHGHAPVPASRLWYGKFWGIPADKLVANKDKENLITSCNIWFNFSQCSCYPPRRTGELILDHCISLILKKKQTYKSGGGGKQNKTCHWRF